MPSIIYMLVMLPRVIYDRNTRDAHNCEYSFCVTKHIKCTHMLSFIHTFIPSSYRSNQLPTGKGNIKYIFKLNLNRVVLRYKQQFILNYSYDLFRFFLA